MKNISIIKKILLFILCLINFKIFIFSKDIYVYFPNIYKSNVVEKKLSENNDSTITVFGRYRDFKLKVEKNPPYAMITSPVLLKQFTEYKTKYSGKRDDNTKEQYVYLSKNKKFIIMDISNKTIGTVDFLGRKGLKTFVSKMTGSSPKIKSVSKIEDLLPLLTFNMVDAILIPERYIQYFKSISKLNLIRTDIPEAEAEILVYAIKKINDMDDQIDQSILKKLIKEKKVILNIEQWKKNI